MKVGEQIPVEGASTNFQQKVDSIQIEHDKVNEAKSGNAIGLKIGLEKEILFIRYKLNLKQKSQTNFLFS